MCRYFITISVLTLSIFLITNAYSTTWYVHPDSALNSIQAGLDSCATNDTVLVGPGTYCENLLWPYTYGIRLLSEAGRDSTIIDGQQTARVIFIPNIGDDPEGMISGFTIQNGHENIWHGGGIYCCADLFTINDNIITNNDANFGGGICCYPSTSRTSITNNIISGNEGNGGGIYCHNAGAVITNNAITGNIGRGIYIGSNTNDVLIRDNTITNNPGGIEHFGASATASVRVTNNLLDGNYTGIILKYSNAIIDSCTISNNIGTGISCDNTSNPTINYNNIESNTGFGVLNLHLVYVIDAEYNWWGDASGPYHPDSNPGGLGDSVSDYVDFIPWLTQPVGVIEEKISAIKNIPYGTTIFSGPLQLPQDKAYRVFDITGRVVIPEQIKPGIYFIEVDGNLVQKIIKVR